MNIRKILQILAATILYVFAVYFCLSAKEDADRAYLLLSDSIDATRAEDIFFKEATLEQPVGFCFWGELNNQWVSCKETGGIEKVTKVLLSGNPGLLDTEELTWQEGCFLNESTAKKLFGTAVCAEQAVWNQDRYYRVLDTIVTQKPTMVTVTEESDGQILNRCVLSVPVRTGKQTAAQFLLRWGLAGEFIDYYPFWVAVYDYLLVLPGILIVRIYFYRRNRTQSRGKKIILLLTTVCLLILLNSKILFFPDMFPSRWSDFSFWGIGGKDKGKT